MGQSPLALDKDNFFDFAVSAADVEQIVVKSATHQTVAGQWHGCSVDRGVNTENTDIAARSACEQHVAFSLREGVVPDKTGVRQLTGARLEVVLHRRDVELEAINVHAIERARHQSV